MFYDIELEMLNPEFSSAMCDTWCEIEGLTAMLSFDNMYCGCAFW